MSGDNGSSYQKYDGASGTYQEVEDGGSSNGGGANGASGAGKKGWIRNGLVVAAIAALAVGAYYTATTRKQHANKAIDKTLSESGSITVKSNGKLKLFDNLSKFLSSLL